MKKYLLLFFALVLCIGLISCEGDDPESPGTVICVEGEEEEEWPDEPGPGNGPDVIWDFVSWNIKISVTDNLGNNLLNSGKIKNIGIKYEGKEYNVLSQNTQTKAVYINWHGLMGGDDYLLFGEFGPSFNYKEEPFLLLVDQASQEIKFDLYVYWKNGWPYIQRKFYVPDGNVDDNDRLIFGDYRVKLEMVRAGVY